MISFLKGILSYKNPPFLTIDVQGVGYELQVSMNTFYKLPDVGETIFLHTHCITREDGSFLYGFYDLHERFVFREIIKITGVGPKLALTILSGMSISELMRCIQERDVNRLVRLPKVGRKTAERLLVEMQGKFAEQIKAGNQFTEVLLASEDKSQTAIKDAVNALVTLGYGVQEANKSIANVSNQADDSETLIRLALQNLGK